MTQEMETLKRDVTRLRAEKNGMEAALKKEQERCREYERMCGYVSELEKKLGIWGNFKEKKQS